MKKIIGLTLLAMIMLILLIVGCVNIDNKTNIDVAPSSLGVMLLVWVLSTVITVPILKRKNNSAFLTTVVYIQIFAAPLNAIIGLIYVVMSYMGHFKNDSAEGEVALNAS